MSLDVAEGFASTRIVATWSILHSLIVHIRQGLNGVAGFVRDFSDSAVRFAPTLRRAGGPGDQPAAAKCAAPTKLRVAARLGCNGTNDLIRARQGLY